MLSETGLHKTHIGRTRAECRTQSSRASLARPRRASASHFRAPDTSSTGVDDSAPLVRTAHRKACADAVSRHRAGWLAERIPSGGSLLEQGSSALRTCVRSIEGSASPTTTTAHHAIVSNAKWRTSQPSACNGSRSKNEPHVCMSRLAAECHETAQAGTPLCEDIRKGRRRERIIGPHRV